MTSISEERNLLGRLDSNDSTLTTCRIDDTTNLPLPAITKGLTNNSFVEILIVHDVIVDDPFLQAVQTLKALKHLELSGTGLTVSTARQLSQITAKLHTLDLFHNPKLGPRGCKQIAETLYERCSRTLLNLNLSHTQVGHYGAQYLSGHLPPSLLSLNLSHNALGSDGLWKLAERFPLLVNLQSLDLSYNQILDDGGLEVAKHLVKSLNNLKVLNLAGNEIHDTGMQGLAVALARSNVTELYLNDNQISEVGAQAFAENVLSSLHLEKEDENENQPSPATTLRVIDLSSNQIKSDGCSAIAEALARGDHAVQSLNLANNSIDDEGAGNFVEILDDIPTLQTLQLSGNTISEACMHILDMLLKHRVQTPREHSHSRATRTDVSDRDETVTGSSTQPLEVTQQTTESHDLEKAQGQLKNMILDGKEVVEFSFTCFSLLTDGFSAQRIKGYGTFGPLYIGKENHHKNADLLIRKMQLGAAGTMQTVRDAVSRELASLRHENLLFLQAIYSGPSCFCFLYDVFDQSSLADLLRNDSQRELLSWPIRVSILQCIAQALAFLHDGTQHKPMTHGDVKAENIFIASNFSTVRLIDGGLSRLLATDRNRFASGDVVFGSRGYRCPRYERGSCQYDTASDIYSYGIVLGEVLTGTLQRSKTQSGMAYDIFYDIIMVKESLKPDPLAGPNSKQLMELLTRILASCVIPVPDKRPSASYLVGAFGQIRFGIPNTEKIDYN
jgi:Ran GTPase-activating protein (RanGAP) involved in mRNA processing and transport